MTGSCLFKKKEKKRLFILDIIMLSVQLLKTSLALRSESFWFHCLIM